MNNANYIYKKLTLENLELNKYYTFYRKDGRNFKGIFIELLNDTLILTNYKTEKESDKPGVIRTIPKDWISHVESEEFKIKVNNFIS